MLIIIATRLILIFTFFRGGRGRDRGSVAPFYSIVINRRTHRCGKKHTRNLRQRGGVEEQRKGGGGGVKKGRI